MDTVKIAETSDYGTKAESGAITTREKSWPTFSEQVETMTQELIGCIADKWSLIVLEELHTRGVMRFNELRKRIPNISQKMLTQTLRHMERNGLVTRKVYPVIPPRVEYQHTELGLSLCAAVCGLWTWVEAHSENLVAARTRFDASACTNG
jgi:DNA-binding HxlR family transcriptional regulator